MIYPIYEKQELLGYYGLTINPEIAGVEIQRVLKFNLFLIPVLGLLIFLLFMNIGNIITQYLNSLIEWTEDIIKGNFQSERTIQSHDEIQHLSENFNKMRLNLRENFEKIKTQNEELKKLDHLKSDLISNISHELRTPITVIYGIFEMILGNEIDLHNQHQTHLIFQSAFREVKGLKKIVENFIVFSLLDKEQIYLKTIINLI